jgi:hypothetical protein
MVCGYFRATRVSARLHFVKKYALYFLKDRVLYAKIGSHFVYEDGFNNIISSEQQENSIPRPHGRGFN